MSGAVAAPLGLLVAVAEGAESSPLLAIELLAYAVGSRDDFTFLILEWRAPGSGRAAVRRLNALAARQGALLWRLHQIIARRS